jgi:hypothetical protein
MRITTRKRLDQTTVTALVGRLRAQAELSIVLNNLYELFLFALLIAQNISNSNAIFAV